MTMHYSKKSWNLILGRVLTIMQGKGVVNETQNHQRWNFHWNEDSKLKDWGGYTRCCEY